MTNLCHVTGSNHALVHTFAGVCLRLEGYLIVFIFLIDTRLNVTLPPRELSQVSRILRRPARHIMI